MIFFAVYNTDICGLMAIYRSGLCRRLKQL